MAPFILFSSLLSHISHVSFCCLRTFFPRYQMFCSLSLFSSFQPLSFFYFLTLLPPLIASFFFTVFKLQCSFFFVCWQACFVCNSSSLKLYPFTPSLFLHCMHHLFTIILTVCILISLNFLPFSLFHLFTCFDLCLIVICLLSPNQHLIFLLFSSMVIHNFDLPFCISLLISV